MGSSPCPFRSRDVGDRIPELVYTSRQEEMDQPYRPRPSQEELKTKRMARPNANALYEEAQYILEHHGEVIVLAQADQTSAILWGYQYTKENPIDLSALDELVKEAVPDTGCCVVVLGGDVEGVFDAHGQVEHGHKARRIVNYQLYSLVSMLKRATSMYYTKDYEQSHLPYISINETSFLRAALDELINPYRV